MNAKAFAEKWAGRGYEKGDTASFWLELLRDVVGMEDVTTNVRFETNTSERGYIDVVIADAKTFIEQKSISISLDAPAIRQGIPVTPFEQAKRYADSMPNSQRPDRIIVCNFNEFRIHDLDKVNPGRDYISFTLDELPEQLYLLDFLIDPQRSRRVREEKASLDAGRLIGELYELLRAQYVDPDDDASQHSLNVLCVRLVFCLFAEDADTSHTQLRTRFDPEEVAQMKADAQGNVTIDGPTVAAHAIRHGLVDRIDVLLCPVVVGDGLRFLPDHRLDLDLQHEQRFDNGMVQLRYDVLASHEISA